MRAPPISSSVTFSPTTTSAIRGDPRYMLALPSTMMTTSQNAGIYAPPAADGPNSRHTCGTRPESITWLRKILPAWRRPGNICTWSVMRAPAESTRYRIGTSSRSAVSCTRRIFSTVLAPQEPALTVGSLAITQTGRPPILPTPVITPSAGRSSASTLANNPSSTKEPSSRRSSRRRRTGSLFCSASRSRCRTPPARALVFRRCCCSARVSSPPAGCWVIARLPRSLLTRTARAPARRGGACPAAVHPARPRGRPRPWS